MAKLEFLRDLLSNHSCKVFVGCLAAYGTFTTGEVTRYDTVQLKEVDKYVRLDSVLEVLEVL